MKQKDIRVKALYTNEKGRFRLVLASGEQYKLYEGQGDSSCLRYRSYRVNSKGNIYPINRNHLDTEIPGGGDPELNDHNCTLTSFASWAKREATDEEKAMFAVFFKAMAELA